MLFAQIDLPYPNHTFSKVQLDFLTEALETSKQIGEIIILLHGDYTLYSFEQIVSILSMLYIKAFSIDRHLDVYFTFDFSEHPLLRLSSIRSIFIPKTNSSINKIAEERKHVGFSPLTLIQSSYTYETELASSSLSNILATLHNQPIIKSQSLNTTTVLPLTVQVNSDDSSRSASTPFIYHSFSYVGVSGTFDRLHPGHKVLITMGIFTTNATIHFGLTGPILLKSKADLSFIQSYNIRKYSILKFAQIIRPEINYLVTELVNNVGPADGSVPELQCIVLSEETKGAIKIIEHEREKYALEHNINSSSGSQTSNMISLQHLSYVVVPLLFNNNDSSSSSHSATLKISSTDLRKDDKEQ